MKGKKPVITICGFYGSGNSGDEAMLRTFVHQIRKRIPDCIFYVSSNKFGTWTTKDLYYISGVDRTKLKISDLFILGGGDLSIGFGWNLLPFAKYCNCKVVMASVSINETWLKRSLKPVIIEALNLCDKIYVRDFDSYTNLESLKIESEATTDVAIELLINDNLDFNRGEKHATLCVREVAAQDNLRMIKDATFVLEMLSKNNFTVSVLPLCASDRIITEQLLENRFDNVQIVYSTEPEHHKYIISKSDYLISLGRLHSLIYATGVCVPMIGVSYPNVDQYHKIESWMKYIDMEDFFIKYGDITKEFEKKWSLLRFDRASIINKLITQKRILLDKNQKQFDEIANLLS